MPLVIEFKDEYEANNSTGRMQIWEGIKVLVSQVETRGWFSDMIFSATKTVSCLQLCHLFPRSVLVKEMWQ